jgi:hypothetical protein
MSSVESFLLSPMPVSHRRSPVLAPRHITLRTRFSHVIVSAILGNVSKVDRHRPMLGAVNTHNVKHGISMIPSGCKPHVGLCLVLEKPNTGTLCFILLSSGDLSVTASSKINNYFCFNDMLRGVLSVVIYPTVEQY